MDSSIKWQTQYPTLLYNKIKQAMRGLKSTCRHVEESPDNRGKKLNINKHERGDLTKKNKGRLHSQTPDCDRWLYSV